MENRKTEAGRFMERMEAVLLAGTVFAGSVLTGCGRADEAGAKSSSEGNTAAETTEAAASEEAWGTEYGMTGAVQDSEAGAGETLRYPGEDVERNTEPVQKNAEEYSQWEEKGFSPV